MPFFLQKRSLFALFVALALLLSAIGASAFLLLKQTRDQDLVQHTLRVQFRLSRVLSLLENAETGQRGYLLTGGDSYLAPFNASTPILDKVIEELGAEISDNERQVQALATLRIAANDKIEELRQTVELKQANKPGEALALVLSNKGQALMDKIRDVIGRMQAEEQRLLDEREQASRQTYLWSQFEIGGALLLTIVLGWIAVRDTRGQLATIMSTNAALVEANQKARQDAERRERLEGQLRQSQKMEAVGQLTGGIAHDFNNMLAVVIGSLNLLKRRLARGEDDFMTFIDGALDGAERAATLTHRLLAFSRQQPLAPQPIDANKFVAGMADMVRRTLGDAINVETVLAGGLWRTYADPGQLESAILNLAVNCRDAMPDGGNITVETANASLDDEYSARHVDVPAGQYVLVSVTDTGCGMPPEVIAQAFDPFFSTKSVGKGTGLGLSQVLGFVKQSGGHAKIYSEIGQGTAIKIYLPRFFGNDDEILSVLPRTDQIPIGQNSEVVLVVEDEERMLRITVEAFRELQYTVLHASSPTAALQTVESHPEITLLFTDVVMPEMNGRILADEATRRLPHLKVLFTTGFSRNAVIHNNVLDRDVNFLAKPFTVEQLAFKVRGVLDRDK
jgi:signal transduction histidine kinase